MPTIKDFYVDLTKLENNYNNEKNSFNFNFSIFVISLSLYRFDKKERENLQ